MGKVHKLSDSECYTPSSELFTFHLKEFFSVPTCPQFRAVWAPPYRRVFNKEMKKGCLRNRSWKPMGLEDVEDPTLSHKRRWVCQPYAPAALYSQRTFLSASGPDFCSATTWINTSLFVWTASLSFPVRSIRMGYCGGSHAARAGKLYEERLRPPWSILRHFRNSVWRAKQTWDCQSQSPEPNGCFQH
jgi:hypothetical protein